MISLEVVSHFKLFHSFMEDWVFGYSDGAGVVTQEGMKVHLGPRVGFGGLMTDN
jgi:hypothetical protein